MKRSFSCILICLLAAVQTGELAETAARMDVPVKFVTSCMR